MAINSDIGPYHDAFTTKTFPGLLTELKANGFTVGKEGAGSDEEKQKNWIDNHWTDTNVSGNTVGSVVDNFLGLTETSTPSPWGIFSYSNMGEDDDLMADLKKLDNVLAGIGTVPAAAYPARATGAQQVIPAGAGATIVINIYPGGADQVQAGTPAAHSPGQAQPATSGPTQTIDAQASKLKNEIQWVKALKEKVAAKLQQLETLQNDLQVQAKQARTALKKELGKNKDED